MNENKIKTELNCDNICETCGNEDCKAAQSMLSKIQELEREVKRLNKIIDNMSDQLDSKNFDNNIY